MPNNTQNVSLKKVHVYKLIHFPEEGNVDRSLDFVPAGWIRYDPDIGSLTCKFMPPPYNVETSEMINQLIRTSQPAPENWRNYPAEIVGEADSYDEAVEKVEVLRKQRYAFSTESEGECEAKVLALKKIYKSEYTSKSHQTTEEEQLLNVPSLIDPNSNTQSASSNSSGARKKPQITKIVIMKPASQPASPNDKEKSQSHAKQSNQNSNSTKPSLVHKPADKKSMVLTVTAEAATSAADSGTTLETVLGTETSKTNDPAEAFLKAYRSHSTQMGQVQVALTQTNKLLKALLEASKNPAHVLPQLQAEKNFAEAHGILLPFEKLAAFEEFDARLGADKVMCALLKRDMWPLIEPKGDLSRSIGQIIKKYMLRAVVMNFTAVRKCTNKKVFKDTIFCTCIKQAVVEEFAKNPKKSPIKDKMYFDAVGTVINNAKDWEGQRVFRTKKRNALQSEEPISADAEKSKSADPEKPESADSE